VEDMLFITLKPGYDIFVLIFNVAYDALFIGISLAQGVEAYLLQTPENVY
jgi:hypothetical protein